MHSVFLPHFCASAGAINRETQTPFLRKLDGTAGAQPPIGSTRRTRAGAEVCHRGLLVRTT